MRFIKLGPDSVCGMVSLPALHTLYHTPLYQFPSPYSQKLKLRLIKNFVTYQEQFLKIQKFYIGLNVRAFNAKHAGV